MSRSVLLGFHSCRAAHAAGVVIVCLSAVAVARFFVCFVFGCSPAHNHLCDKHGLVASVHDEGEPAQRYRPPTHTRRVIRRVIQHIRSLPPILREQQGGGGGGRGSSSTDEKLHRKAEESNEWPAHARTPAAGSQTSTSPGRSCGAPPSARLPCASPSHQVLWQLRLHSPAVHKRTNIRT
eukprot:COSAG01_NODE_21193_length_913_cov_8.748157_1_plen_180_part_00